nr:arginine--tRNA ligase [Ruminococcus sp.]
MSDLIKSASLQLRELINDALGVLVAEGVAPAESLPAFAVEIPADKSHGDFAANTAMVCARAFKMPPRKIAELIIEKIDLTGSVFERAEIAGPGFMNFFLSRKWFAEAVEGVLAEKENYGRTDYGQGKRVLVEFVSANPTGPMHIGNARGGAIGDCLASVLDWAGYHAEREFYV